MSYFISMFIIMIAIAGVRLVDNILLVMALIFQLLLLSEEIFISYMKLLIFEFYDPILLFYDIYFLFIEFLVYY